MQHITLTPQRLTLSAAYIYEKDERVRSRNFQRPKFYYKFARNKNSVVIYLCRFCPPCSCNSCFKSLSNSRIVNSIYNRCESLYLHISKLHYNHSSYVYVCSKNASRDESAEDISGR